MTYHYLNQRWFRLATRKCFFTERLVGHQNKLIREVMESPALKVFKKHADIALGDMV